MNDIEATIRYLKGERGEFHARERRLPELKECPECEKEFLVGGRGNGNRSQVYCSRHCAMKNQSPRNTGSNAPRPKKNLTTLHNKEWLHENYVVHRKSCSDIARELNCSVPGVIHCLKKFNIPVRGISEALTGKPNNTVWTEEMRAHMTEIRARDWLTRDRVSKRRGQNYDPDPNINACNKARQYNHGICAQTYQKMLDEQGGVCKICKEIDPGKSLAVDHDHQTGKIRGLLCSRCNLTLGQVQDSQNLLIEMISYLDEHEDQYNVD